MVPRLPLAWPHSDRLTIRPPIHLLTQRVLVSPYGMPGIVVSAGDADYHTDKLL